MLLLPLAVVKLVGQPEAIVPQVVIAITLAELGAEARPTAFDALVDFESPKKVP